MRIKRAFSSPQVVPVPDMRCGYRRAGYFLVALLCLMFVILLYKFLMSGMHKRLPVLADQSVSRDMELVHSSNGFWEELKMTAYFFRGDEQYLVFLFPDEPIGEDDIRLYWQPLVDGASGGLAKQAVLLGRLTRAGGRYELASDMWVNGGELVLMNVTHNQVLGTAMLLR